MNKALLVSSLMLIGSVSSLNAQEGGKPGAITDPVEILKKADEASKTAKSVQYKATAEALFADAEKSPKVSGTVLRGPQIEKAQVKSRVEAKVSPPGSSEVQEITVGCDGNNYYVIDAKNKTVYQDVDPNVVGSFRRSVGQLRMQEYGHETPFTDEINAKAKELKGTEKVGGEDCYHILVQYTEGGQEADWYFSTKDFLPRRVDRAFIDPRDNQKHGGRLTVTDLVVNPKTDDQAFAIVVPAGFEKIDDFAP